MLRFWKHTLVGLGIVVWGAPVEGTTIVFDVVHIAGNTFEYSYTIENDTLGSPIEEFAVYFELALFEDLRAPSAPPDWDPIVVQPDAPLMDDGFYDAFALGGGLGIGGIAGGFSVLVDFLGPGSPGSQRFEIFDPVSFAIVDRGVTSRAVAPVSEPASLFMLGLGLAAVGAASRPRRRVPSGERS